MKENEKKGVNEEERETRKMKAQGKAESREPLIRPARND